MISSPYYPLEVIYTTPLVSCLSTGFPQMLSSSRHRFDRLYPFLDGSLIFDTFYLTLDIFGYVYLDTVSTDSIHFSTTAFLQFLSISRQLFDAFYIINDSYSTVATCILITFRQTLSISKELFRSFSLYLVSGPLLDNFSTTSYP